MAVVRRPAGTIKAKVGKGAAPVVAAEVTLPTTLSAPSDSLGDYSVLLFGRKKVGKTRLSSMFPKSFHMMTEPGGKALKVYQRPVTKWSEFIGYVKALEKDKTFKTQVVDTADILFNLCTEDVCRRLGITHPSEADWGKGWAAVREEFTRWITRLMSNGKGTIFISHSAEKEIKKRSGEAYHSIQPTLPGTARDILEGIVDIFAYFDYDEDRRVLMIRGDETVAAGNRLSDHFTWNGREVSVIEMGNSPEEAYANFVACFENRYQPRKMKGADVDDTAPKKKGVVMRKKA